MQVSLLMAAQQVLDIFYFILLTMLNVIGLIFWVGYPTITVQETLEIID